MYTYSYGIQDDTATNYFNVLYRDQHLLTITPNSCNQNRITVSGQIQPFPFEAQEVVEDWLKFARVKPKVKAQVRKSLGYNRKSFAKARSAFGASDEYATPNEVLDFVREFGPIGLDPFGMPGSNVKAAIDYVFPFQNGFTDPWIHGSKGAGSIFSNPPFSKMAEFGQKWLEERQVQLDQSIHSNFPAGKMFGLVPGNRSDQPWYHVIKRHSDYQVDFKGRTAYLVQENGGFVPKKSPSFASTMFMSGFFGAGDMKRIAKKYADFCTITQLTVF